MKHNCRRDIKVGPGIDDVTPVATWYRDGHFKTEEEARGAFKLAHQQGLDGMGKSVAEWMGLTFAEFNAWMKHDALPPKRSKAARRTKRCVR